MEVFDCFTFMLIRNRNLFHTSRSIKIILLVQNNKPIKALIKKKLILILNILENLKKKLNI